MIDVVKCHAAPHLQAPVVAVRTRGRGWEFCDCDACTAVVEEIGQFDAICRELDRYATDPRLGRLGCNYRASFDGVAECCLVISIYDIARLSLEDATPRTPAVESAPSSPRAYRYRPSVGAVRAEPEISDAVRLYREERKKHPVVVPDAPRRPLAYWQRAHRFDAVKEGCGNEWFE